jgi:TfoX/Sxy family transcriptional regulator of competence genes
MPFDEKLADRIREAIADKGDIEEKKMFRGMCFMLNGKMCICVSNDEMMCRIGHDDYETALEMPGCRQMMFTHRPLMGYVLVSEEGMKTKKDFNYWIKLCLDHNPDAKSSKKKKK